MEACFHHGIKNKIKYNTKGNCDFLSQNSDFYSRNSECVSHNSGFVPIK